MMLMMMGLTCYDYRCTRSSCFEQEGNNDIGGDDWALVEMGWRKGEHEIGQ